MWYDRKPSTVDKNEETYRVHGRSCHLIGCEVKLCLHFLEIVQNKMLRILTDAASRIRTWVEFKEAPPVVLGRWRNVSRGMVDSDAVDPGYTAPNEGQKEVSDDFVRLHASWTM